VTNIPELNARQLICSKNLFWHASEGCMVYLGVIRRILWDEVSESRIIRKLVSTSTRVTG